MFQVDISGNVWSCRIGVLVFVFFIVSVTNLKVEGGGASLSSFYSLIILVINLFLGVIITD